MKVQFAEISEFGNQYEITEDSWFPDKDIERCSAIQAHILLERKSDSVVTLRGRLETAVRLVCDRCLMSYILPVDVSMQIIFHYSSETHWKVNDIEGMEIDLDMLDTVILNEPAVDIGDVLRQQVLLTVPQQHLCREECKGLCSYCGCNLNIQTCSCAEQKTITPFNILKKLRKS